MRRICLFFFLAIFLCTPFPASHGASPEVGTEAGGLAQAVLAKYLQNVAFLATTGNKARLEQFFDELMTTDFYKKYGVSWISAKSSEILYARYLENYVKPRSVNAMLKTSLVIATGIALPMIVEGKFEGKVFAISAASLGLSTAAVKAGVKGLAWVEDLRKAKQTGTLGRVGVRAGRLARLGGWFYVAAEQAVILYVEEEVKERLTKYFDFDKERENLAVAVRSLLEAINDPDATGATLERAVDAYHDGWTRYRNFLYRPLERVEEIFAKRLQKVARSAKILVVIEKAFDRINAFPALRRNVLRRYSSLEKYADHLWHEDQKKLDKEVNDLVRAYNESRERLLQEIYVDKRRESALLGDIENLDGLVAGARPGPEADPRKGRRAMAALEKAVKNASRNRIQTYDDESEILAALESRLRTSGREGPVKVLARKLKIVRILKRVDGNLIRGNGSVDTSGL